MSLAKQLVDRLFSFRGVQLRSNIIGTPNRGLAGVNPNQLAISGVNNRGATTQMNGSKFMSEYYRLMDELPDYQLTELTKLIINAYSDFIDPYFTDTGDLVSFVDGRRDPSLVKVNQYLEDLGIRDDIKASLKDLLYWNSKCSLLSWDSNERTFKKKPLIHGNSVVTVYKDQKIEKYLVLDKDYNICELGRYSILRYGSVDLDLVNNIREEKDEVISDKEITQRYEYRVSMPIYYDIAAKVKEYVLNDQIISLLNIKDLIQPLLLLISCDKNTDVTTANNLANNIENLINKYTDISTIFTARFSVNDLMDSIINNIRVLPDWSGAAGNLGTVDLSKLKEKTDQIRGDQDTRKEAIVNSLSLTMDLLQGRTSKWDALRQSERLQSCISGKIGALNDSVIRIACDLYYITTKKELSPKLLRSNLFTKTATELQKAINNTETVSSLIQNVFGLTDQLQQKVQNDKVTDSNELFKYVKSKIELSDPDAAKLLNEQNFRDFVDSLKQQDEGNGY